MNIELKYFGRIEELVNKTTETIVIEKEMSIIEFKKHIANLFPILENESYKLAINKELVEETTTINTNCEIALLPPFAGG